VAVLQELEVVVEADVVAVADAAGEEVKKYSSLRLNLKLGLDGVVLSVSL
jgi:hypothetical protein